MFMTMECDTSDSICDKKKKPHFQKRDGFVESGAMSRACHITPPVLPGILPFLGVRVGLPKATWL